MNTLDIILLVLLLIAAVAGWRKGIIVQACGIAGLVLGILFAMRFSRTIGGWLGVGEELSPVLGFVVILVVSILVLALIGYLFKKVFRLTGFGIIDRLGGLALSVVKIGMLLAVLTGFFARMNDNYHWVKPETISDSVIYRPLQAMTDAVFPYLVKAKEKIFDETPSQEETKRAETEARPAERSTGYGDRNRDREYGKPLHHPHAGRQTAGDAAARQAAPEREPHDKSRSRGRPRPLRGDP